MKNFARNAAVSLIVLSALSACNSEQSEQQSSAMKMVEASTDAPQSTPDSTSSMEDARNGIERQNLGGRAFTVVDFGSAPEGDAQTVVDGLKESALAGNAKASYGIYLKIRECASMMKTFETKGASSINSKKYENCKNLSAENFSSASEWLERAASQGNLGAQLLYVADPEAVLGNQADMLRNPEKTQQYKESAVNYLRNAANRGSVDALLSLGNAYQVGTLVDSDAATSYAYYQTVERIAPDYAPQTRMEALRKELTPQQISLSRTKSMEIFNECCSSK